MADAEVKKPKIVEIKRKPKITNVKEDPRKVEENNADDFGDLVENLPVGPADISQDLRKKQLDDIKPIDIDEELRKEKKKRFRLF